MTVNGRVSALLELGAGFNPEFTGRDNVYLNGSILGLTTREIDERYKDIENFAEIGDFINQPVKTYSSGMVVRLAFAVAINVDPEILLVDEALAVGDIYFRQRCMRKVHELRSRGVTILFVSHAVSDVKAIGDRVLWLDHGRLREIGEPDAVISRYLAAMTEKDSAYLRARAATDVPQRRAAGRCARRRSSRPSPTSTTATATGARRSSASRCSTNRAGALPMLEPNSRIVVRISVRAKEDVRAAHGGLHAAQSTGHRFFGHQHARARATNCRPCSRAISPRWIFTSTCRNCIRRRFPSRRRLPTARLPAYTMCDWIDNAVALQMSRQRRTRSTDTCTCRAAWK